METSGCWRWLGSGVLLGLLTAVFLLALTLAVAHATVICRRGVERAVRRAFAVVLACLAVVVAPAALWAHAQAPRMLSWADVTYSSVRDYPYQLIHSVPLTAAMAILMGLLVLARHGDRGPLILLLAWSLVPPLILLALTPVTPVFYYLHLQFTV